MKYIIMADGKGTRWNNYLDIPKHLITVNGEVLIERTVRLLNEKDPDATVIITSHDERYEIPGSYRYEPKNNHLEIDRFTEELIEDNICFLYGDTYYTDEAVDKIIQSQTEDVLFFGNEKSITAIKIKDGKFFKNHVDNVRNLYCQGKIKNCKGWQVYDSIMGLDYNEKRIDKNFIYTENTTDYNTPEEYRNRKER